MEYIKLKEGKQYVTGIYAIENKSGSIYIGSAVSLKTRYMTHRRQLIIGKHDNQRLQNHYNKHGKDSLVFRVIEICEREILIQREQYYIDMLNPFFNIAKVAGATYGLKPWLNKKHSEETKAKIKNTNLLTFAARPKKETPIKLTREENNQRLAAINKTEEGRKRCSELHKGNTHWLGKKHKPETIANRMGAGNGRARKIYCVELGREFSYCKEASEFLKVSPGAINNAITRKNKVLGKYTFNYVSDENN